MPRNHVDPVAVDQAQSLQKAINDLQSVPRPGVAAVPIVQGLTAECTTLGNLENKLAEVTDVLVNSKRVFHYGNSVVQEIDDDDTGARLVPLLTGGQLESGASGHLRNRFKCEVQVKGERKQIPPSDKIVLNVLLSDYARKSLPRIKIYSNRPVFTKEFEYCGPGWHPKSGVLIHGKDVTPVLRTEVPSTDLPALDRLPLHLRTLLSGFCFQSDADLANTVGMMLTGMLMTHHIETLHPLVLVDANQAELGKTTLAKVIGVVLDGRVPKHITFTANEQELGKQLLSTIRDDNSSCVLLDNAKVRAGGVISSSILEACSTAPEISLRILGQSQNYVRPNDLLWFLTMNDTKISPDLVSRCVPIRLFFEGDPKKRMIEGPEDVVGYARTHRLQILGELAGMVMRWRQQGGAPSSHKHRLPIWAKQIGGILGANNLPEFLANAESAANDFNTELDDLGALAEQCLKAGRCWFPKADDSEANQLVLTKGARPSQWRELLKSVGLMEDELQAAKGTRSAGLRISNFLGKHINREVTIRPKEQELTAKLRGAEGRSREKFYCFEISGEIAEGPADGLPADTPNNETKLVAKPNTCARQPRKPKPPSSIAAALSPAPLDARKLSAPSPASKELSAPAATTITVIGTENMTAGNSESWA
jgi:hypothetical protein